MDAQIPGLDIQAVVNHWWKWRETHKFGVEIEEDVVHGSVAPKGYILNVFPGEAKVGLSLFRGLHHYRLTVFALNHLSVLILLFFLRRVGALNSLVDQPVEPFDNIIAHPLEAVFSRHVKRNSRHHIFAVLALRVHKSDRIDYLHSGEIAKVPGYRGGPNIDSDTISMFNLAWPNPDDLLVHPNAEGHLPVPVAQCHGELP